MASIDFSKPLATLLKDSTREAHEQVEHSEGAKLLLSGELTKEEYTRYLMMLWHVYNAIETALEKYATHPSLEPTYNPALLARAPALASDISYLLQVDERTWKSHRIHLQLMSRSPTPLLNYVRRIEELSQSSDPSALLAHSYVRYLGDLSGGQTIRHTIAKAYGLDEAAGLGISFYAFKELRSSKPASQGEMKRIKDWFRAGINTAGERGGVQVKTAVVEEANLAFKLNAGLFELIETHLDDKNKEGFIQAPEVPQERLFSVASVTAVILAMCLSHFVLVVGGFTGDSGYQKLLAAEQWVADLWSSISK